MATVTVSSKYQIVIPKEVREALDIKPGQKLGVLVEGRQVHLVPIRGIDELMGIAEGADTSGIREKVDRV